MSRRAPQEEESIYNLIPQPTTSSSRPALYRSKYPHDTPPTGSTFATRFEYTNRTKPALETHHAPDSAVVQNRTQAMKTGASKNFISENALAVIMADARRPVRNELDYTKKADFGKTPAYLESVKAEIAAEKNYIRQVMEAETAAAHAHEPTTSILPEEERQALLQQLKLKWEAVNKQYQTTTHMIMLDTMGKIRRKEKYEAELQQIERGIQKLSSKHVVIQNY